MAPTKVGMKDIGLSNKLQKQCTVRNQCKNHRQIAREMDELNEIERRLNRENAKSARDREVIDGLNDRLKEVKA